jgi:hypothetical protein
VHDPSVPEVWPDAGSVHDDAGFISRLRLGNFSQSW